MTVRLTRRDAIAALTAAGIGVGAGAAWFEDRRSGGDAGPAGDHDGELGRHERDTLVAVAEVVYPSAVTGLEAFVGTYLEGKAGREGFDSGVASAVAALDARARDWHGDRAIDLDIATRETLLREVGADTAEPDPSGTPPERIRYYVVNELLFALYASPTGGRLVGLENPQGHPGGLASYRRGPDA